MCASSRFLLVFDPCSRFGREHWPCPSLIHSARLFFHVDVFFSFSAVEISNPILSFPFSGLFLIKVKNNAVVHKNNQSSCPVFCAPFFQASWDLGLVDLD